MEHVGVRKVGGGYGGVANLPLESGGLLSVCEDFLVCFKND